jgi:tripartite-type tricarboxylate transporter receptor subunit TctC
MQKFHSRLALAAVPLLLFAASPASALDYPTKPIELIVPFSPGGTTDNIARLLARQFAETWPQQPVVVNNRPGGGSTIGTAVAAKAAPDGHTVLVSTIAYAISAGLRKTPYDPVKSFDPVTQISEIPLMLVVHKSLPVNSVKELVELAKKNPGKLDYASSGAGTSPHLAGEMFKTMAGIDMVHVPYKGNAPVQNALLGGHVKIHFGLLPAFLPHVKAGTLKVLAVTTAKRLDSLPDVPTVAELGYPGFEISSWQGLMVPAGTPKEIIDKLRAEVVKTIETPAIRKRMLSEGAEPVGSTPEQFSKHLQNELTKWGKVIKDAGMSPK